MKACMFHTNGRRWVISGYNSTTRYAAVKCVGCGNIEPIKCFGMEASDSANENDLLFSGY